jgi:hypothetical protein
MGQKEAYNALLWQHSDLNLHTCIETDTLGKGTSSIISLR